MNKEAGFVSLIYLVGCALSTTLGHYVELWGTGYGVGVIGAVLLFAIFSEN